MKTCAGAIQPTSLEAHAGTVLYDNDLPGKHADRVFVENRRASKRLVDHVLDLGHERVAIIHGNLRDSVGRDRLEGYRDA